MDFIFQQYTGLVATTGATVLEVHGRNDPRFMSFDDFAVVASTSGVTSPVPEPVTGFMLLAGLGVLGVRRGP